MSGPDPEAARVAAVVLAAGESSRLGAPKQLVRYQGQTLVRRAVAAALGAGCESVYVVVGAHRVPIESELEGTEVVVVENPTWREGLSSSIAAGVRAAAANAPDAWLILLTDQPHLSVEVLERLLDLHDGRDSAAACRYSGSAGVPAIFGAGFRDRLTSLSGDRGARALLEGARLLDWEEGAVDIDTPEDLAELQAHEAGSK